MILFGFVSAWLTRNECATNPSCCLFNYCKDYSYTQTWPDEDIDFMDANDLDNDPYYSDSNVNYDVVTQPLLS